MPPPHHPHLLTKPAGWCGRWRRCRTPACRSRSAGRSAGWWRSWTARLCRSSSATPSRRCSATSFRSVRGPAYCIECLVNILQHWHDRRSSVPLSLRRSVNPARRTSARWVSFIVIRQLGQDFLSPHMFLFLFFFSFFKIGETTKVQLFNNTKFKIYRVKSKLLEWRIWPMTAKIYIDNWKEVFTYILTQCLSINLTTD